MNTNFKIVNDDYGIDLSIEIDKAIKRGEKPSVIEQIKKYQEQQKKYEQKPTAGVSVTIYTDTDKICFRLRGKEWKRTASAWSDPNPFGTSDTHDMETALTLCRDIKTIIGKSSNTDYGA